MISHSISFSKSVFLNSKGEKVDPKSREKHIDDAIGNNPNNAIDFIDDAGLRVTMSKKTFMGILNSIYKLDTSIGKQEFINAVSDVGGLKDGLVNPISIDELFTFMNHNTQTETIHNNLDNSFNSLHKVGVKFTKVEFLEMLQKNQKNEISNLKKLQQNINIDTETLLTHQKNRQNKSKI